MAADSEVAFFDAGPQAGEDLAPGARPRLTLQRVQGVGELRARGDQHVELAGEPRHVLQTLAAASVAVCGLRVAVFRAAADRGREMSAT